MFCLVTSCYLRLSDPGLLRFVEVRRDPRIELVEVIEIRCVELVGYWRLVWRNAASEVVPIYRSKEGVIFDLLDSVSAETDFWVKRLYALPT
jgi:hypothetical protein